jgi:hypothetical protein
MPSYQTYNPTYKPNTKSRLGSATGGGPQYPDPYELAKLIPDINLSMPGIQQVASGVNRFQQGELLGQFEDLFPGLKSSIGKAGDNIQSMLEGIVPMDVQRQLQGNTAARSLMQGVPGSQFAGNQFGEALGLTSLDLQGKGLQELMGLTGNVRQNLTVNPYDIGQNIPNLTDLYNVGASQETANAAERRRMEDLALMREFYGSVGGGNGGGGMSIIRGGGGAGPSSAGANAAYMGSPWGPPAFGGGDTRGTRDYGNQGGGGQPWSGFAPLNPYGYQGYGGGGGSNYGGGFNLDNDAGFGNDFGGGFDGGLLPFVPGGIQGTDFEGADLPGGFDPNWDFTG